MNKKRKLTYGPRDIDDVSFCVPCCMVLYLLPVPSILVLSSLSPLLCMFWLCGVVVCLHPCCHLVVVVLIVHCHLVVVLVVGLCPLVPVVVVVVVVVCPLVIGVGDILSCCFCCGSSSFSLLHPPHFHCASCSLPPHEQVLVAMVSVWVCHLGIVLW